MKRIQRILVGLDLGPHSIDVWREACVVARAFQAELTLLHAVSGAEPRTFDVVASEVTRRLNELARDRPADVTVASHPVVRPGPAAEALLSHAREVPTDLVLIGAGTRTRHDVVLLGSTAERVVRDADAPVWVVRPGRAHAAFERVLAALDPVAPQPQVARAAGEVATAFKARLTALAVVDRTEVDVDASRGRVLEALAAGGVQTQVSDVAVRQAVKAAAELVDSVSNDGVDLMVVGDSGRGTMTRLLEGNTAEKVLRVAPCSILRVNPRA